jgi:hypothetical protein
MTTLWKLQEALYTMYFERQFKDRYGNGASLSMGAVQGKPGGRAPLVGTLKDM